MIAVAIPAGFDRLHPRLLSEASGVLGLGLVLMKESLQFQATHVSPQMTFSFSSLLPGPNLFIKNLNHVILPDVHGNLRRGEEGAPQRPGPFPTETSYPCLPPENDPNLAHETSPHRKLVTT